MQMSQCVRWLFGGGGYRVLYEMEALQATVVGIYFPYLDGDFVSSRQWLVVCLIKVQ